MRLTTQRPKIKGTCNPIKLSTCNNDAISMFNTEFYCIPKYIESIYYLIKSLANWICNNNNNNNDRRKKKQFCRDPIHKTEQTLD